jgi:hypothetical protein
MTSDLPLLSYIGTFQFLTNTRDMINKSVKQVTSISKHYGLLSNTSDIKIQWPGAVFKVPDLFQWVVVASGSNHLEDIYKAPDNVLSFSDASAEVKSISESCSVCKTAHRHTGNSIWLYARIQYQRKPTPCTNSTHTAYSIASTSSPGSLRWSSDGLQRIYSSQWR